MDFKTIWYQIITNIQKLQGELRVCLNDASLGFVTIKSLKENFLPYKYSCYISAFQNGDKAEIGLEYENWEQGIIKKYSFTSLNQAGESKPLLDTIEVIEGKECTYLITTIDQKCPPLLAQAIAKWIVDSINTRQAEREISRKCDNDETSVSEAANLLRLKAEAKAGNVDAQLKLARQISFVSGRLFYDIECNKWLRIHAELGNPEFELILGKSFLHIYNDLENEEDKQLGVEWLLKSANHLNPSAAYALSELYRPDWSGVYEGLHDWDDTDKYRYGTPEYSRQQEWHWLHKAADLKHEGARFDLATRNLKSIERNNLEEIPAEYLCDASFCLKELRELATAGHRASIDLLAVSDFVGEEERFNWRAFGSGLEVPKHQVLLADSLRFGKGVQISTKLAERWLISSLFYKESRYESLLKLSSLILDSSDLKNLGLLRLICVLKHYQSRQPDGPGTIRDDSLTKGYRVVTRNRHLLIHDSDIFYILDTGSPTSPSLHELNVQYPGIRSHIHNEIGADVWGIFGNDRIMAGSGFILDMRNGETGMLWIVDPSKSSSPDPISQNMSIKLPCISIDPLLDSKGRPYSTPDDYRNRTLKVYLDTGAQYSYLNSVISDGVIRNDFTVIAGRFETFTTQTQSLVVNNGYLSRACQFGNLPEHLSGPVFAGPGIDAIIGPELLHGSILCWRQRDNLCHLQDGTHADLANPLICSDLKATPRRAPTQFESYYLGYDDYGSLSFSADISNVTSPTSWQKLASGVMLCSLTMLEFDEGGRAFGLTGRHRTMFITACFFKVLIDQVFHHHFNHYHNKYEQLNLIIKLSVIAHNVNPDYLICDIIKDDPAANATFVEAKKFFESELKALVVAHFPSLQPDDVWNTVAGYLPQKYPYLT